MLSRSPSSVVILALAIAVVVTAFGCGTQSPTAPATTATPVVSTSAAPPAPATTSAAPAATSAPPATSAPTTAATAAKPTGKLTVAVPSFTLEDVVPHLTTAATLSYYGQMFDFLVGSTPDGKLSTTTGIATGWSTPDAGVSWNFKLRSGVKFHNGQDLTAEDVKFSIGLAMLPEAKSSNAGTFQKQVKEITVNSPTELTIKLNTAIAAMPALLSSIGSTEGAILPKAYYSSAGLEGFRKAPIASGPFKFVSRATGSNIKFEANETYWRGAPGFKELTMLLVPEVNTRLAMLRTGEASIIDIPRTSVKAVQAEGFRIQSSPYTGAVGMQLYHTEDPSKMTKMVYYDKRVRQALALSINKQELLDTLMAGRGEIAPSYLFTPPQDGYDPSVKPYPYDPAKAKQLLQDAGMPSGKIKIYTFPLPGLSELPDIAAAIAGYWEKIGVQAELVPIDFAAFRPMYAGAQQPFSPPGAGNVFTANTTVNSVNNVLWYAASKKVGGLVQLGAPVADQIDPLYQQASVEADATKRTDVLKRIDKILYDEYLTIPLVYYSNEYAVNPKMVKSWSPIPGYFWALALENAQPVQ